MKNKDKIPLSPLQDKAGKAADKIRSALCLYRITWTFNTQTEVSEGASFRDDIFKMATENPSIAGGPINFVKADETGNVYALNYIAAIDKL